jgi:glycosyltransferase involved in cell wall biosynthesis
MVFTSFNKYSRSRLGLAAQQLRATFMRSRDLWPTDERAGMAPSAWKGWPEGKRFALVLTHDVVSSRGLARVNQLIKLEAKHGFISSFNFVPEGQYRVPDSLPGTLDQAGCEVGILGLEDDGKLFRSKDGFASKATRIRKYLERWRASGFRSRDIHPRLTWLHELHVEYDASCYDADPFRPETDSVGTVFPFWVESPGGTGFVELPSTLPQGFTLFTILREKHIDVWRRKLDWIAAHGGMALLNTPPDNMCLENGKPGWDEFPAERYEEFLRCVNDLYRGTFWHALPRDVSRFYCASLPPASRNTRKKICMVVYSGYPSDNRVRRYAETLAKRGDQVEVIALSGPEAKLGTEFVRGVTVHRIQSRDFKEKHKWKFAWRLIRFLLASSATMAKRHRRVEFDLIHVHNVPDFLVFAAWYPKLTGAKIILDIHDIVPELFASKFESGQDNRYIRMLKSVEKASAAFSDHVIVSNHLWQKTLVSRSVAGQKCSVFMNHVDPAIFYRRARTRHDDKFIMIFPGSFQWHQGLDIAIEALGHMKDSLPNAELHLYGGGTGDIEACLVELTNRLGLNGRVKFLGGVAFDRIADEMANADLGVVPKRADSFGNEAYSTKIMEFMSQGTPVVVSRTKIDTFYFDESVVHFFSSGDSHAMAKAIMDIAESKSLRERLAAKGLEYADVNSWDRKKYDYLALVDSLTTESFKSLK